MNNRFLQRCATLTVLGTAGFMFHSAAAQDAANSPPPSNATTTVGRKNAPLYDGAQAMLAGQTEYGVELTLEGLALADNKREKEAALTNLCTGYLRLRQFETAMKYCDMLIDSNDNAWRAYNVRAMIYLEQKEFAKADQELKRAEAINPGAQTLKVARAMYTDAVNPVAPAIEIDDRGGSSAK